MTETARTLNQKIYHATTPHKALSILRDNRLFLPFAETNSSEAVLGSPKLFYMSMARTAASGYIAGRREGLRPINEAILFVFDSQKLRRRGVTTRPVDYYGGGIDPTHWSGPKEAEERVYSDHQTIKNIHSAILEIRLVVFTGGLYTNPIRELRRIAMIAKTKRIPVKFFTQDNKSGFIFGREKVEDRKLATDIILKTKLESERPITRYSDAIGAKIVSKKLGDQWISSTAKKWKALSELVYFSDKDKLGKEAKNMIYNYIYRAWEKDNFYKLFEADIHNMRADPRTHEKERLARLIKKMKARGVRDFFDKLSQKWNTED